MEAGKKSQRVYMDVVVLWAGRRAGGRGAGAVCVATAHRKKCTLWHWGRGRQLAAAAEAAAAHWHCRPDTPRQRHTNTKAQKTKRQTGSEQRAASRGQGLKRHKNCTSRGTQPMAVTATARHVYGQKAYAAATAAAEAAAATSAAREAASRAATIPPYQTQTSICRTVVHASLCRQAKLLSSNGAFKLLQRKSCKFEYLHYRLTNWMIEKVVCKLYGVRLKFILNNFYYKLMNLQNGTKNGS